jgi:hypothetical protein
VITVLSFIRLGDAPLRDALDPKLQLRRSDVNLPLTKPEARHGGADGDHLLEVDGLSVEFPHRPRHRAGRP